MDTSTNTIIPYNKIVIIPIQYNTFLFLCLRFTDSQLTYYLQQRSSMFIPSESTIISLKSFVRKPQLLLAYFEPLDLLTSTSCGEMCELRLRHATYIRGIHSHLRTLHLSMEQEPQIASLELPDTFMTAGSGE